MLKRKSLALTCESRKDHCLILYSLLGFDEAYPQTLVTCNNVGPTCSVNVEAYGFLSLLTSRFVIGMIVIYVSVS